ncbi:hypothetical protein AB0K93_26685 [Streptomyces sp. NPDC052676]|uniref:hypothetical protein n=1 Tax=Streptomyces sp. NPDC052676 TaxID=3154953 RepID=UPI0034391F63
MWPGQQQPGGEQNPQGQNNPYQQPGYQQQPNPYQQPGYQQPNPYQQQPQWNTPAPVGAPQPATVVGGGGGGGGNRTKLVAIVAATAVVVAAGVTGFLVLGGDKDEEAGGGSKPKAGQSPTPTAEPTATASGTDDNPRDGEAEKPTIAGWKVVVNPKWGVAFDVPADWEVQNPGMLIAFEEENADELKPLVTMTGTAVYQSKWCTSDSNKDGRTEDTSLAAVGTKGADGAKNTDEVAINTVAWWIYGGYTQPDKKSVVFEEKAEPFTTASGIKGSIAWAESKDSPRKGKSKCATDGKAMTFGFQNSAGNYVSWNFFGAKGVKKEVSKETILKIAKTVRLHGEPTES